MKTYLLWCTGAAHVCLMLRPWKWLCGLFSQVPVVVTGAVFLMVVKYKSYGILVGNCIVYVRHMPTVMALRAVQLFTHVWLLHMR